MLRIFYYKKKNNGGKKELRKGYMGGVGILHNAVEEHVSVSALE